jgi:hypothetical protein
MAISKGSIMEYNEKLASEVKNPVWEYIAGWCMIIATVAGIFWMLGTLTGCVDKVSPSAAQPVYNITDNSQTTIISGDNNRAEGGAVKAQSVASPSVKQDAEQTTKSGMWIVWLVLILAAAGAGAWWYFSKKKES